MKDNKDNELDLGTPSIDSFSVDKSNPKSLQRKKEDANIQRVRSFQPKIEMIPIEKIKPYKKNARINKNAVYPVRESIEKFGMNVPITIDKDYIIATGHTRFEAMKQLGYKEVPCIVLDKLNEEEIKAWRLVDNRTNEFASWDFDQLKIELEEITDIDLSPFEFDIDEKEEKEKKKISESEYSVHVGDTWCLGDTRLIVDGDRTLDGKEHLDVLSKLLSTYARLTHEEPVLMNGGSEDE